MRLALLCGLALCCWCGPVDRNAFAITIVGESFPIDLSPIEERELEDLACKRKHGVLMDRVQAHRYQYESERSEYAQAFCKPHGSYEGKQMRYVVSCEKKRRDWKCGEPDLEVILAVGQADVAFSFGDLDFDWAYDAVSKLVKEGWLTANRDDSNVIRRCTLQRHFIPEWFSVHCLDREITISTWCPQEECPSIVSSRAALRTQ
jgi:hypothetical protein